MSATPSTTPFGSTPTVRIEVPKSRLIASKERNVVNPWRVSFASQQGTTSVYKVERKKGVPQQAVKYPQYKVSTGESAPIDTADRTFGLFAAGSAVPQDVIAEAARLISPIELQYWKDRDAHLAKTGRGQGNASAIPSVVTPNQQHQGQSNAAATTSSGTPNRPQSPQTGFVSSSVDNTTIHTPSTPSLHLPTPEADNHQAENSRQRTPDFTCAPIEPFQHWLAAQPPCGWKTHTRYHPYRPFYPSYEHDLPYDLFQGPANTQTEIVDTSVENLDEVMDFMLKDW